MASLWTALEGTEPAQLRLLVMKLCETSETVSEYFTQALLISVDENDCITPKRESHKRTHSAVDEKLTPSKLDEPATQKKTKLALRFERCVQCKNQYDVTLNTKESCAWHSDQLRSFSYALSQPWKFFRRSTFDFFPGELELQEDLDVQEIKGQALPSPEDFPEFHNWNCCDKTSEGGGCEQGFHKTQLSIAMTIGTLQTELGSPVFDNLSAASLLSLFGSYVWIELWTKKSVRTFV